jgi:hypothetical protein
VERIGNILEGHGSCQSGSALEREGTDGRAEGEGCDMGRVYPAVRAGWDWEGAAAAAVL